MRMRNEVEGAPPWTRLRGRRSCLCREHGRRSWGGVAVVNKAPGTGGGLPLWLTSRDEWGGRFCCRGRSRQTMLFFDGLVSGTTNIVGNLAASLSSDAPEVHQPWVPLQRRQGLPPRWHLLVRHRLASPSPRHTALCPPCLCLCYSLAGGSPNLPLSRISPPASIRGVSLRTYPDHVVCGYCRVHGARHEQSL